jgi:hypothetical protein
MDIGEVLGEANARAAIVDLDWLCWITRPPIGTDYDALARDNLRSILPNLRTAGVTHLVLARAVPAQSSIDAWRAALPGLVVLRVTASARAIESRLKLRDHGAVLEHHLIESRDMTALLDLVDHDHIVANDGELREVTLDVLRFMGWS